MVTEIMMVVASAVVITAVTIFEHWCRKHGHKDWLLESDDDMEVR